MPSTYLTFTENISQGPSTLQKNSPPKSTWAKAFLVHDRPQERQQIYNTIYKFYIKHIPVIAAYKKIFFLNYKHWHHCNLASLKVQILYPHAFSGQLLSTCNRICRKMFISKETEKCLWFHNLASKDWIRNRVTVFSFWNSHTFVLTFSYIYRSSKLHFKKKKKKKAAAQRS